MKRYLILLLAVIACAALAAFTGCGGAESADGGGADSGGQVEAPYIGYAPLDETTFDMVETFQESYDGSPQVELLSYDAGDNNKAIVRMEMANKDGSWEILDEQSLYLIGNVSKGLMVFRGDAGEGVQINTKLIDNGSETLSHNRVRFDGFDKEDTTEFYFGALSMFSSGEDVSEMSEEEILAMEERMDMTSKKVLQMNFGDTTVFEKDGKVLDPDADYDDDTVESNINDIYLNKDGKYDEVYKSQELAAVTIEFVNDEVLVSAPCFYTGSDKDLMYHAGTCSIALVTLEKSTKDGKWEQVGEEELLDFISNVREGKMKISGSLSDGEITIGTKDIVTSDGSEFKNQASFTVDDADSIKSEMDGVRSTDGYVKASKKVILKIASTGGNAFGDASAAEIYKNKDGQFDDLYQDTMYVLAFKFED